MTYRRRKIVNIDYSRASAHDANSGTTPYGNVPDNFPPGKLAGSQPGLPTLIYVNTPPALACGFG
jgi:hypothetical protein